MTKRLLYVPDSPPPPFSMILYIFKKLQLQSLQEAGIRSKQSLGVTYRSYFHTRSVKTNNL